MIRSDDAFLLSIRSFGDADAILSFLTSSRGALDAMARSARSSRRRFGGCLEPMAKLRVEWTHREGRDLQTVRGLELLESNAAMQSDPAILAACAVVSEVTRAVVRPEDEEPRSYRLIATVLEGLKAGVAPSDAVRYFLYWTLRLHGVLDEEAACSDCGAERATRVSVEGGSLVCGACARRSVGASVRLGSVETRFLAAARTCRLRDLDVGGGPVGGPIDTWLRGGLSAFVERPFKTFRHLDASVGVVPVVT